MAKAKTSTATEKSSKSAVRVRRGGAKTKISASPSKPSAGTKTEVSPLESDKLWRWNIWLAVIHGVQGLAILILSTAKTFPVTINYLGADSLASQAKGQTVLAGATQHVADVRLAYLVAAFFFISAIAHGLAASRLRAQYERGVWQGVHRIRWIEYSLSASTMLVAIGLLSGVYDLASLVMIFAFGFIMNMSGLLMELANKGERQVNWRNYLLGCVAGAVPWIVLLIYLIGSQIYGGGVPGFVWAIYVSLFVFFDCFAINMYLQYKRVGKWQQYLYGEYAYMVLSLAAKTALAWQVFAGSLRP